MSNPSHRPTPQAERRLRSFQYVISTLIFLALLGLGLLWIAVRDAQSDIRALEDDNADLDAKAVVQDVRDDFGALMDTVQVVGVVFTLIAGGAALLGLGSFSQINDRAEKVNQAVEEVRAIRVDVQARVAVLNTLRDELLRSREETATYVRRLSQALAFTELAQYQMGLGNDAIAREQLELAHDHDPDNRTIAFLLGDLLSRQGEFDEAESMLKDHAQALAMVNGKYKSPWAAATYAYVLRALGSKLPSQKNELWEQSNRIFERLWVDQERQSLLDTHGESVFGAYGGLLFRLGQIDDAIRIYEKAASVTLRNSYPINNLGLIHFGRGELPVARGYFARARRKAFGKYLTNADDYYAVFDLITARLAMTAIDAEQPPVAGQDSSPYGSPERQYIDIEQDILPHNLTLLEELIAAMEAPKPLEQLADGLQYLLDAAWFQASHNISQIKAEIVLIQQRARDAAQRR